MKHTYLFLILLFTATLEAKEIRIAVLDSGLTATEGINLCVPLINLTKSPKSDFTYHGNNVTHIISDGLTNYCIISIKVWGLKESTSLATAIYESIRLHADIINISGGGEGSIPKEAAAIRYAEFKHIIVVTAAGNDSKDLTGNCYFYPACYPTVVTIGNSHSSSNYGPQVDYWLKGVNITAGGVTMTGTSQAAAMFTHKLAKKMSKVNFTIADK